MARQGRCNTCRKRMVWEKDIPARIASYCPICGSKLQSTTHVLKWPVKKIMRPLTAGEAYHITGKF